MSTDITEIHRKLTIIIVFLLLRYVCIQEFSGGGLIRGWELRLDDCALTCGEGQILIEEEGECCRCEAEGKIVISIFSIWPVAVRGGGTETTSELCLSAVLFSFQMQ